MDTATRLHGPNFRSATHKPLLRIRGILSHQYKLIAAPSFQRTPEGPKCQLSFSSTPAFSSALIKAEVSCFFVQESHESDEIIIRPANGYSLIVDVFEMPGLLKCQREFRGGFQCQAEIFRHVLEGKLCAVIVLAQFGSLEIRDTGMRDIGHQCAEIDVVRDPSPPAQCETFAQGLSNSGDVEVHGELQCGGRTQRTDVHDGARDGFENGARLLDYLRGAAQIINSLALFRCDFASRKWRLQKPRARFLDLLGKEPRPFC